MRKYFKPLKPSTEVPLQEPVAQRRLSCGSWVRSKLPVVNEIALHVCKSSTLEPLSNNVSEGQALMVAISSTGS